ncbi:hypothetical protein DICVIV_07177 [Dictyocaulus viviparus]|uniref:Uncharacterized protein n=1 Tax=Dictyocaulus viviparus TaxID=29172 RepID=A0A0D8XWN9_DICVI|nr:hypothetical protein DICVIV_07177 [Dictyocaulus viviparus]
MSSLINNTDHRRLGLAGRLVMPPMFSVETMDGVPTLSYLEGSLYPAEPNHNAFIHLTDYATRPIAIGP